MWTEQAHLGRARTGVLTTAHGKVPTPAFMPIATRGAVKQLANSDLVQIGNDILLANTYHLYLRPGLEVLRTTGGLHAFMHWDKPILTDSGGFQVFSLAHLRKLTPDGVRFNSHIDGAELFFTPELAMEIQQVIGSDIQMCFDYFPGFPASRADAEQSVALTTQWAKRCAATPLHPSSSPTWERRSEEARGRLLFAIVQGSSYADLRQQSAQELVQIGFDGYAIGGLAVGEPVEVMYAMLDVTVPFLPQDKPHYLMGVGQPEQILEAVKRGVDLFDCVLPSRNARHGQVYLHTATELVDAQLAAVQYCKINLTSAEYKTDAQPLDPLCHCTTCQSGYSRAYLRHLFSVAEPLAQRLTTVHNVSFYIELMRAIRNQISKAV